MTTQHTRPHIPVLLAETIDALQIQPGAWYVDATFGRGGHTTEMLKRGARVIAIDHDEEAITYGKSTFVQEIQDGKLVLEYANFDVLGTLPSLQGKQIAGVLFDFGVSSTQLDTPSRGFTFQHDAPLDMRMDIRLGVTAKDLVNALGKKELYKLLTIYAQEARARKIVDAILFARVRKPIETTRELSDLIEKAVGGRAHGSAGHLHPATKTFMALRMAVNDELGNIERALPTALDVVMNGGHIVAISFHEGEDRIVKQTFFDWEKQGKGVHVTRHPIEAKEEELRANPRSRSAKLRMFEKGKTV